MRPRQISTLEAAHKIACPIQASMLSRSGVLADELMRVSRERDRG